jgi:hypothetical protein
MVLSSSANRTNNSQPFSPRPDPDPADPVPLDGPRDQVNVTKTLQNKPFPKNDTAPLNFPCIRDDPMRRVTESVAGTDHENGARHAHSDPP